MFHFVFKGYDADCVLLCGTAVVLMLNTCPESAKSTSLFHSLLAKILSKGKPGQLYN